jgi:hypothetical protein
MQSTEELYTEQHAQTTKGALVPRRRRLLPLTILGIILLAPIAYWLGSRVVSLFTEVRFPTTYQAVLLSNGQVYFGKLAGYGGPHPVLTDVYYVQGVVNAQTKETSNTLLKRGSEWHAPDRMWLNPAQIILVEPVKADSRVAQLINQLKGR